MDKFRELGIIESILEVIREEKFEEPTEIQRKAIPLVLSHKDIIAGSSTGSGKTLVFSSGIIKDIETGRGIQALVLTPTRELAEQIYRHMKKFSKNKPLKIASVYGGLAIGPQIEKLKTADVVIGTPGRILDHLSRGTLNLNKIKILVLDEADRMFDMGFIDDIRKIIGRCPEKRQTLLFSATISQRVYGLAEKYMKNPVEVEAENYVDPKKLTQIFYDTPDELKFSLLVTLLKREKAGLVMVFCNTRRTTDFVAENLKRCGINALAIHGGHSQDKRGRTMDRFHSKNVTVLVCTDVAARGLDVPEVSHIYNYDIPRDAKEYIHRIGRTARAGKEGKAVNILTNRDYENFSSVLEANQLEIPKAELPNIDRVRITWRDNNRGRDRGTYSGRRKKNYGRGGSNYGKSGGRRDSRRDGRRSSRSYSREDNMGRSNNYRRRSNRGRSNWRHSRRD